jgi:hypothetical protein
VVAALILRNDLWIEAVTEAMKEKESVTVAIAAEEFTAEDATEFTESEFGETPMLADLVASGYALPSPSVC